MANLFAGLFGASSGAIVRGSGASELRAPSYSFDRLKQLCERFLQEGEAERGGSDATVETVRQITEALIWGEQNDSRCFEFFCKKNVLAQFIAVLGCEGAPKKVQVQLLQTLSMLIQNVRHQTSLIDLLNNNHVNRMISMPLDLNNEEILAYYITLMKSLAMRLDADTIQFFFIQHPEMSFPLYIEATKLFSHRDQMVRATVRTITLQVYRVGDVAVRKFVLRHAQESHFSNLAYNLRDLWIGLDEAANGSGPDVLSEVQHKNELQQDLLIYLSDVFELEVAELNEVLADRLLNCVMLPVLLRSIMSDSKATDAQHRVLSPVSALSLLRQVFHTFKCQVLLRPLASALFQPRLPAALAFSLPNETGDAKLTGPTLDGEGDLAPNELREHFIRCLEGHDGTIFLLAAAVVHSCVRNRKALPLSLLQSAMILPAQTNSSADGGGNVSRRVRGEVEGDRGSQSNSSDDPLQVFQLLLQVLYRHTEWRLDSFPVILRILLDIILDPCVNSNSKCEGAILKALHSALRGAAQRLNRLLEDDVMIDILFNEWELHKKKWQEVSEACANTHWIIGSTLNSTVSGVRYGSSENDLASPRYFLFLRRLLVDIAHYASRVPPNQPSESCPWACNSDEVCPLLTEEEISPMEFREGSSLKITSMTRIACAVPSSSGKVTRYLLLHSFWFLLVEPDLTTPGFGLVRTCWPLWQVQSFIDRSDPRTLWVGMRGPDTAANTASTDIFSCVPMKNGIEQCDTAMTITLNFDDVKRCCTAESHLHQRRQCTRMEVMKKAAQFVGQYCSLPMTQNGTLAATLFGARTT